MRILILVLGFAAAMTRPAFADLTDSGNLIIGGQGILQGSMTVAGSAFSVGGATFSVAGGSVTLGGILNAAPSGIKWADGTTSTTASSGGGGGGTLVLTSTISANPWNFEYPVASTSPAGASAVWIYGFTSSRTCTVHFSLNPSNTNTPLYVRFNDGDSGANYNYSSGFEVLGNHYSYYATAGSSIAVTETGYGVSAGNPVTGHFVVSPGLKSGGQITTMYGESTCFSNTGSRSGVFGGDYSKPANNLKMFFGAGTITRGNVWVECKGVPTTIYQ